MTTKKNRIHRFDTKNKALHILNITAFPVILLIVWQLLSLFGVFTPLLMPPLQTLGRAMVRGLTSGQIFSDLGASFVRVLWGYAIGVGLGLVFGVFMGVYLPINKFFSGFFNTIRQIPPLAWVPLFILWFGIGETSKIVLIAKSAFFPILINTISGVSGLSKGYLELARLYNIKRGDLITKMYIPSALPSIFTGLRLGAGAAWMAVVASEIIVATNGIGYRINDARNLMESDVVIINMLIIGLVGLLMDHLLRGIEGFIPFSKHNRKIG